MEEKLYQRVCVDEGPRVSDAGAGSAMVASYLAEKHGLKVTGIDLIPVHVEDAHRVIEARGLQGQVSVQLSDYHNLTFEDGNFDAIYTMLISTPTIPSKSSGTSIACSNPKACLCSTKPTLPGTAECCKMCSVCHTVKTPSKKAPTRVCSKTRLRRHLGGRGLC